MIHISVDGLRPDAITTLGPALAPNFFRLRTEGSFTDNARTDFDSTVTLPNHASQLTGRPVLGAGGHDFTANTDIGGTIHDLKGSYVASAFDVVHDNGFSTGLYAGKSKFALLDRSWDQTNGAPDTTGPDNGRDKIDRYVFNANIGQLTSQFIVDMTATPLSYSLVHMADPDLTGHGSGWSSSTYLAAVRAVDSAIGRIFSMIDTNPTYTGKTAIVLTADHGGTGFTHVDPVDPADYVIPFYAWGPGISGGGDLYAMNASTRLSPGTGRPTNAVAPQPIRNAEAANLALQLLGLNPVPGSQFGVAQDLNLEGAQSKWISKLYDDYLTRSGTFPEIQYWAQAVAAGLSRAGVIRSIQQSAEHRGLVINGFYQDYLGRSVDSGGRAYWLSLISAGNTLEDVRQAVLSSAEYFAAHGSSHAALAAGYYDDLLGRSAGSAEIAYWQQWLDVGLPRSVVIASFTASAEFHGNIVDSVYQQYLNRAADPGGRTWWVNFLSSVGTILEFEQAILSSNEYFTN